MPRGASALVLHRLATLALGTAVVCLRPARRGGLAPVARTGRHRLGHPSPGSRRQRRRRTHQLSIGSTASHGKASASASTAPLDLRLTDIRLTDTSGERHVDIPRAEVSLRSAPSCGGAFSRAPWNSTTRGSRCVAPRTAPSPSILAARRSKPSHPRPTPAERGAILCPDCSIARPSRRRPTAPPPRAGSASCGGCGSTMPR